MTAALDSRPVMKVSCYRCHGFKVIDRYEGDHYAPWPCGACDANGMIEVYSPLPADTWKTRALIEADEARK